MDNTDQEIQTIQKNLKGVKNPIIRQRALMIIRDLEVAVQELRKNNMNVVFYRKKYTFLLDNYTFLFVFFLINHHVC